MGYVLRPSLEHMTLVKITTMLWDQNIRTGLDWKILLHSQIEEWDKLEKKVIDMVSKLPQPELLKQKILSFVKPIGQQIFTFMYFSLEYLPENEENFSYLQTELCWTQHGTIDTKKMAELLIKNERIDISKRYKLACNYCLEADILELFQKMPNFSRKSFYHDKMVYDEDLVSLWTVYANSRNLHSNRDSGCLNYQHGFEIAAVDHGKVATEYFWRKLTVQERDESLDKVGKYVKDAEVLCFLLSQFDAVKHHELIAFLFLKPSVLHCLLDWPLQPFFLEVVCQVAYSEDDFYNFLFHISHKRIEGYMDYKYDTLFRKLWYHPSDRYRRFLINDLSKLFPILHNLFKVNDIDNIEIIFHELTPLDRKNLIFGYLGQRLCQELIDQDEWVLLKFLIGECIPSEDEIATMKKLFHLNSIRLLWKEDKFTKLFDIIDECICQRRKESLQKKVIVHSRDLV